MAIDRVDAEKFRGSPTGTLVATVDGVQAFVPRALPRDLNLAGLSREIARAHSALGELNGLGDQLANPYLLIAPLQRQEALVSSRMEGTVTGYPELFLLEAGAEDVRNRSDAQEVANYIAALQDCIHQLSGLPVSTRLLKSVHRTLLSGLPPGRAQGGPPGEFKTTQNYIGLRGRPIAEARFVPPPPIETDRTMSELETFIHAEDFAGYPPLVHAALVHYQFETIHPFPDGNGRIGRLITPLVLLEKKVLRQPLLYLSPVLEAQKDRYVDLMLAVSLGGNWEAWIRFFLSAAEAAAGSAISAIRALHDLRREFHNRVRKERASANLDRLIDFIFEQPAVSIPMVQRKLGITYPPAKAHVGRLVKAKILRPIPLHSHPSYFMTQDIVSILERDPTVGIR
ncbi:MAG TPA: Fic/DOC family N-terminal domain-containing protein [Rhizomicrobium sp.]